MGIFPVSPRKRADGGIFGQELVGTLKIAANVTRIGQELSVSRPAVSLKDLPAYQGIIQIRTVVEKDTIVIKVSDDGPGLKQADAEKVFDPFFTRKKTMGMGVGLSICYGIVEDHHGSIEFNPAPKEGAECIVSLPLKAGQGEGV